MRQHNFRGFALHNPAFGCRLGARASIAAVDTALEVAPTSQNCIAGQNGGTTGGSAALSVIFIPLLLARSCVMPRSMAGTCEDHQGRRYHRHDRWCGVCRQGRPERPWHCYAG